MEEEIVCSRWEDLDDERKRWAGQRQSKNKKKEKKDRGGQHVVEFHSHCWSTAGDDRREATNKKIESFLSDFAIHSYRISLKEGSGDRREIYQQVVI